MFSNIIKFYVHEQLEGLKEIYPIPATLNVPEWFKNLNHNHDTRTIKGCMPFLDALTAGYILPIPQEFRLHHNYYNKENKRQETALIPSLQMTNDKVMLADVNINASPQFHGPQQLDGSPLIEKNKYLPVGKFLNPFIIKTPPGYSCLFIPPMNNRDDRFEIISGIVDTDTFKMHINFPFIVNGDKYTQLDTVIKRGTPYVQVVPFKRQSWKMKVTPTTSKKIWKDKLHYDTSNFRNYQFNFWNKKSWK